MIIKVPPHLKGAATLPCEMLMLHENTCTLLVTQLSLATSSRLYIFSQYIFSPKTGVLAKLYCQNQIVNWQSAQDASNERETDRYVEECAYPRRDGQAELTCVAGYVPKWFTPQQTVTRPAILTGPGLD